MLLTGIAAAPIIVALVAVIGGLAPQLPRRAYPAVAVAIGIAWNCAVAAALGESLATAMLVGVVSGLTASGLYSSAVKPLATRYAR